jgi:hypothetical protein
MAAISLTDADDGGVMMGLLSGVRLDDMTSNPITTLELHEFRLNAADDAGEAARLVDSFSGGIEPSLPLLVSIDDRRDVAIVRALHASETAESGQTRHGSLGPLVTSWQDVKRYGPRIAERAESPPSYYRLAVTESGINDADPDAIALPQPAGDATSTPIGLLWIGVPVGTSAGLMVLLGNDDGDSVRPDASDWPLSVSRGLGVRIYESR